MGVGTVEEKDLSPRQREWLEASRTIGTWPLTKSERQRLEKLYAAMLPAEQQELLRFIEDRYGKKEEKKEGEEKERTEESPKEPDPIKLMESLTWREPSAGLRSAFSKAQAAKRKPS